MSRPTSLFCLTLLFLSLGNTGPVVSSAPTAEDEISALTAETPTPESGDDTTTVGSRDIGRPRATVASAPTSVATKVSPAVEPPAGPTAQRELSTREAQPGETVAVTIDTELPEEGIVRVTDTFDRELAAERAAGFGGLDHIEDGAFSSLGCTGSQYTTVYEVTIPEDATTGTTYEFSGTVQGDSGRPISGDDSLTVRDGTQNDSTTGDGTTDGSEPSIPDNAVYDTGSPAAEFDADSDGQIARSELARAASVYARGQLSRSELSGVAIAYTLS